MRRRLTLLVVALGGLLVGWLVLRGGGSDQSATPSLDAEAVSQGEARAPDHAPAADGVGEEGEGEDAARAAEPSPATEDAADAAPCEPCFEGVPLDWDRSPEQVAAVHAWPPETMAAATEALWALHEQGQLDFAQARRADQSLHIDRIFGTELDPQVRTAVLDRHSQLQDELATARSGGGGAAAMADAVGSYEAALGDLLTDAQLDRLLNL